MLTPHGERQTSALFAASAASDYRVDCVYTSPFGRAWQMGRRLADRLHYPLIAEPALKKQAFGQFEGMLTSQLLQQRPHNVHASFTHDAEYCPPQGESSAQATQRVTGFIHNLPEATEHQRICIVTHEQVSQGVLAVLKEGTTDNFSRYAHPNASYSMFDLRDGKCLAIRWGIATRLLQLERQDA